MPHKYSENRLCQKIMKQFLCFINNLVLNLDNHIQHAILITISGIVTCTLLSGCTNKKYSDSQSEEQIDTEELANDCAENKIDIPVAINIVHDYDPDGIIPAEYTVVSNSDNNISIDVKSEYYNQYMSGNRFKAPLEVYFSNIADVEYLTLELDIVNNTSERVSVNELDINVKKSEIDQYPLVYICTSATQSNSIQFVNGSWFNWKGFTFSYSILKRGQEFNGKYNKSIHIPYFDGVKTINLLQDLKELGYDFDGLLKWVRTQNELSGFSEDDPWIEEDDGSHYLLFGASDVDDIESIQGKFDPFIFKRIDEYTYEGRAILYGSIKFDQTNIVKDFIAELSLSTTGGFGAISYENDKFDVKLQTTGNDYIIRFPYITIIEPQGAEMVKLRIMADKSSSHNFYVNVVNDNGLTIRSKKIKFHNYTPRN